MLGTPVWPEVGVRSASGPALALVRVDWGAFPSTSKPSAIHGFSAVGEDDPRGEGF